MYFNAQVGFATQEINVTVPKVAMGNSNNAFTEHIIMKQKYNIFKILICLM